MVQWSRPLATLAPRLLERLQPLELAELPTPVEQLPRLAGPGAAELWIKRDDLSSPLYGGNKVRKLELLLAAARRRGAGRVLTMGARGSNHLLATVLHARSLGLAATGVIFPQPPTEHVERNLAADRGAGAELVEVGSKYLLAAGLMRALLRCRRREGSWPYLIPGGGSNPLGALGFVNAGLELAAQVRAGLLPEPAAVYLAFGTGGTAAGLALGLELAGLATRVVAVRVIDRLLANRRRLLALLRATRRLLRSGGDELPRPRRPGANLEIEHRFFGDGYGRATKAGRRAVELFAGAGIILEDTYTGKAAAALLEAAGRKTGPLLYWHTLSGADISSWVEKGRQDD